MEIFNTDKKTLGLKQRCDIREVVMLESTMKLVYSFVNDNNNTYDQAKQKVKTFSLEISTNYPSVKYDFKLGLIQPLKDAVQASNLAFMTQAKKDIVLDILSKAK